MPPIRHEIKWFLLWGVFPATAGILCGHFLPWSSPLSTPDHPARLSANPVSSSAQRPTPEGKLADGKASPIQSTRKQISIGERLEDLHENARVEDLLEEIRNLPPGPDRRKGVKLLAEIWFALDQAAAMAWIESLVEPGEKETALQSMLGVWCRENGHDVSAWVAALPEGPLRTSAGKSLSHTLASIDPSAALTWGLASLTPEKNAADQLPLPLRMLARQEYKEAIGQITKSTVPEAEKQQLKEMARRTWNETQMFNGAWDSMVPQETEPP